MSATDLHSEIDELAESIELEIARMEEMGYTGEDNPAENETQQILEETQEILDQRV